MPLAVTRSTELSGNGMASAGACNHVTFEMPSDLKLALALLSIGSDRSSPTNSPVGPTFCAYRYRSRPAPQPRSSNDSPGAASTKACGFPAPVNDSQMPLGKRSKTSGLYPTLTAKLRPTGQLHFCPG